MKLSALTFLWLVGISGFTAGTSSVSYAAPATDTAIIFSNPVFPTDSLAIEQAAQTIFQKKVTQSNRYYRKLEATNALFLKRLKKQEAHLLSNLAKLAEGMVVKDRTFTMKSLDRGKIVYGAYTKAQRLKENRAVPNFVTSPYIDGAAEYVSIAYLAEHFNNYESTYANMISTIVVHEWGGHGKDKYMDIFKTHHKAYWDVINHPTWDQTTNEYKAFNLFNYKFYLEVETKQGLDPTTQKLYDKYIQYYKRPANYKGPK